jgi:hypothetical protein
MKEISDFFKYIIAFWVLVFLMLIRSFFWAWIAQLIWNNIIVAHQIIASNDITYWQSYLICAVIFVSKSAFYAKGSNK